MAQIRLPAPSDTVMPHLDRRLRRRYFVSEAEKSHVDFDRGEAYLPPPSAGVLQDAVRMHEMLHAVHSRAVPHFTEQVAQAYQPVEDTAMHWVMLKRVPDGDRYARAIADFMRRNVERLLGGCSREARPSKKKLWHMLESGELLKRVLAGVPSMADQVRLRYEYARQLLSAGLVLSALHRNPWRSAAVCAIRRAVRDAVPDMPDLPALSHLITDSVSRGPAYRLGIAAAIDMWSRRTEDRDSGVAAAVDGDVADAVGTGRSDGSDAASVPGRGGDPVDPDLGESTLEEALGEMTIEEPTLRLPRRPTAPPATERIYGYFGRRLRRPDRLTCWRKAFVRNRELRSPRDYRGTILVDASGSMHLKPSEIQSITEKAPAVTIAAYNGGGSEGKLVILARGGLIASDEVFQELAGRLGNIVDYQALLWLAKQPEPRIWVSDGEVTGRNDRFYDVIIDACGTVVDLGRIERVGTLEEAVRAICGE